MQVNNSANKYTINLLQPELLPEKVLLTLPRVVIVWALVLFLMVAWAIASQYTQNSLAQKLKVAQQENRARTTQLEALTVKINNRKVDSQLAEKLATVKLLLANKQALQAKLTDPNQTYVSGFALAMNELSQLHRKDIRLQAIHINTTQMTFSGLALSPEAVPAWLAGFENSRLLSGKSFEHFTLLENEQKITEFTVSSNISQELLP